MVGRNPSGVSRPTAHLAGHRFTSPTQDVEERTTDSTSIDPFAFYWQHHQHMLTYEPPHYEPSFMFHSKKKKKKLFTDC